MNEATSNPKNEGYLSRLRLQLLMAHGTERPQRELLLTKSRTKIDSQPRSRYRSGESLVIMSSFEGSGEGERKSLQNQATNSHKLLSKFTNKKMRAQQRKKDFQSFNICYNSL